MIINKYEIDPQRERKRTTTRRPHGRHRHRIFKSFLDQAYKGEEHKKNTSQKMTEYIQRDSHVGAGEAQIAKCKEYTDGKSSDTEDNTG